MSLWGIVRLKVCQLVASGLRYAQTTPNQTQISSLAPSDSPELQHVGVSEEKSSSQKEVPPHAEMFNGPSYYEEQQLTPRDNILISVLSVQGKRSYHEDRVRVFPHVNFLCHDFFGDCVVVVVCDGHLGSECANFVSQNFSSILIKTQKKLWNEQTPTTSTYLYHNASSLLTSTMQAIHDYWRQESILQSEIDPHSSQYQWNISGTTMVAMAFNPVTQKAMVVNIGDSGACWIQDRHLMNITHPHSTAIEQEKTLMNRELGTQYMLDPGGCFRIVGIMGNLSLNLTRTVGDLDPNFSQFIGRKSDVYEWQLSFPEQDRSENILLLATDGFWDYWRLPDNLAQLSNQDFQRQDCLQMLFNRMPEFHDNTTAVLFRVFNSPLRSTSLPSG